MILFPLQLLRAQCAQHAKGNPQDQVHSRDSVGCQRLGWCDSGGHLRKEPSKWQCPLFASGWRRLPHGLPLLDSAHWQQWSDHPFSDAHLRRLLPAITKQAFYFSKHTASRLHKRKNRNKNLNCYACTHPLLSMLHGCPTATEQWWTHTKQAFLLNSFSSEILIWERI